MMRPGLLLLLYPLLLGCAQPGADGSARAALEDALATQQASAAGLRGEPAPASATIGATPVMAAIGAAPAARGGAAAGRAEGLPTQAGQLVGQPPEAVLHWLGTPRLRRREGTAEVWHYQASQCHLDLVLYRDEGGGRSLRVAHAAARAAGASIRGEAACLTDIARGATTPASAGLAGRVSAGL